MGREKKQSGQLVLDPEKIDELSGWSPAPAWGFDPSLVPAAAKPNLRRWDFFTVMDQQTAISLTMADIAFGGFYSVEVLDLVTLKHHVNIRPFRNTGRLRLSSHPRGNAAACSRKGDTHLAYTVDRPDAVGDAC